MSSFQRLFSTELQVEPQRNKIKKQKPFRFFSPGFLNYQEYQKMTLPPCNKPNPHLDKIQHHKTIPEVYDLGSILESHLVSIVYKKLVTFVTCHFILHILESVDDNVFLKSYMTESRDDETVMRQIIQTIGQQLLDSTPPPQKKSRRKC